MFVVRLIKVNNGYSRMNAFLGKCHCRLPPPVSSSKGVRVFIKDLARVGFLCSGSREMLASVPVFLFCLGLRVSFGLRRCPSPSAPPRGTVTCRRDDRSIPCASAPPANSLAEFACLEFYRLSAEERRIAECLPNGRWSSPPPKCVPDCGRRSISVSLIVNGATSSPGAFPWHVGMYHLVDGSYEYWCGGSLVSETAVITAAHCVWQVPPETLMLAFGKFDREYGSAERNVQKIRARRVETLESYQDVGGNYNGDIAVVFLERAVSLGHYAAPVCLDWDQKLVDRQLVEETAGVVPGWGLTENDTFSDRLRVARLPVVSDEKCIAAQEQDFKKFVTYTSFCAGFGNGTGVCNGDSGGGMSFFDEDSGRWYLQGLVSVSPRRRGTPYCDPRFYTVFTKVAMFSKWLKGMKELRGALAPHDGSPKQRQREQFYAYKNKRPPHEGIPAGDKKILFLHTNKILELAGLSTSTPESLHPPTQ